MPSVRMKPMKSMMSFKRKGRNTPSPLLPTKACDPEGVPMITPIDPDGSTASHDSNEIYLSTNNANSSNNASSHETPPDATMTASQFITNSDQAMTQKRSEQPPESPHTNNNTSHGLFSFKRGKNSQIKSKEGVPIITADGADHFSPSAVSTKNNYATDGFYSKSKKTFGGKERPKVRPSAKCSAFGGAPRYDWMDIETTAAIKIQAAYRRLQTQNKLDDAGISTPGMRNRRAQRRARYQSRMSRNVVSADVPFPFNMCGVGLLFGDGTLEDEQVVDTLEKRRANRAKKEVEREDVAKRKFRMRKKESQHLEEGIEVVESFDKMEEEGEGEGGNDGQQEQANSPGRSKGSRSFRNKMSKGKSGKKSSSRSAGTRRGSDPPEEMSPGGSRMRDRSKSKRMARKQNEFNPAEEDSE